MFKAKASTEVKIAERTYQFICEADSPMEEVIDVLKILVRDVQSIFDKATKKPEVVPENVVIEDSQPV